MENSGPRPGARTRPLTPRRAAVLELLVDQPEPVTLAALVDQTDLHPNTLREHLDALMRQGWVRRRRAEPDGRGRPAWLYEATAEGGHSEYAGLAAALAGLIADTAADPVEAAHRAGEEWGRDLARERGAQPSPPDRARGQVLSLLEDLGFEPRQSEERPELVRLTRCPLLEAAHKHTEIVCGVHLGLVRGFLDQHGAPYDGAAIRPFAEPGACLLVVPPVDDPVDEQP